MEAGASEHMLVAGASAREPESLVEDELSAFLSAMGDWRCCVQLGEYYLSSCWRNTCSLRMSLCLGSEGRIAEICISWYSLTTKQRLSNTNKDKSSSYVQCAGVISDP